MDKKWVDEFFATGAIQLSSFAKFRGNPHEQSGDRNEGDAILIGVNDKQTVYSVVNYTPVAYVMSTSLKHTRELAEDFECNGCFRINDTLGFSAAIAKCIPQCKGGMEGFCSYTPHKSIQMRIAELPLDGGQLSLNGILGAHSEQLEAALIFSKSLTYIDQQEYRLAWGVPAPAQEYLRITCPEARQFCDNVDVPTRYWTLRTRLRCYEKRVTRIASKFVSKFRSKLGIRRRQ